MMNNTISNDSGNIGVCIYREFDKSTTVLERQTGHDTLPRRIIFRSREEGTYQGTWRY